MISFKNKTLSKNQQGFSLIETLVGTAVFVLIAISTYQVFIILMDSVSLSRAKISATSLANEQFEIIRNLAYQDVGILGGIPSGKIQRNQILIKDSHTFAVKITIRNIDDPFDGTIGGNPSDLSPADYKLVDLDINCIDCKLFKPLNLTTIVSPKALETISTNGALFIRVFDSEGLPIQNTSLHIENKKTEPFVIIDETTDNDGWLKIVDARPGIEAYNITATKTGYSTDKTYKKGAEAGLSPVKQDATVVLKQVTQLSLSIDKLSALDTLSINNLCEIVPDVEFSLTGTKLIGTPSVLKYNTNNFKTNELGQISIPSLEWDSYLLSLQDQNFSLAGIIPMNPILLLPNENKTLKIITIPRILNSLLISVRDNSGVPLNNISVLIEKEGFNETKITSNDGCNPPGQVFWNGLSNGTYNITINNDDYATYTKSININSVSSWQKLDIVMEVK